MSHSGRVSASAGVVVAVLLSCGSPTLREAAAIGPAGSGEASTNVAVTRPAAARHAATHPAATRPAAARYAATRPAATRPAATRPAATRQARTGPTQIVYIDAAALFPCRIRLPEDYDPARTYTLVVGLHGHGGRADEFFTPSPLFAEAGVIYAVPQAPYAYPSAGRIGYSWSLRGVDDEADEPRQEQLTADYILRVVQELRERYSVGNVYLMGFSQGGAFTYRTAIRNPARFAGLIAFGSRFDPEWFAPGELEAGNRLRVFVSHGRDDPVVSRSTLARDTLREHGYEVDVYEFDGGHVIARSAIEELLSWLQR